MCQLSYLCRAKGHVGHAERFYSSCPQVINTKLLSNSMQSLDFIVVAVTHIPTTDCLTQAVENAKLATMISRSLSFLSPDQCETCRASMLGPKLSLAK